MKKLLFFILILMVSISCSTKKMKTEIEKDRESPCRLRIHPDEKCRTP